MASIPVPSAHCSAAAEKPFSRMLRLAGTGLLAVQALLLTSVALFGIIGPATSYRAGSLFFLLTSVSLLACTLWRFRNPTDATRWLFLPCLACFVALFFTDYAHGTGALTITTPSVTRYANPTLPLVGLVLMSMVLSRFLRWSATRAACNCG